MNGLRDVFFNHDMGSRGFWR
jgi:hypothetical protein